MCIVQHGNEHYQANNHSQNLAATNPASMLDNVRKVASAILVVIFTRT